MSKSIKLIMGLGNAGPQYQHNRHNVGFMANDIIASQFNITQKSTEHHSIVYTKSLKTQDILIAYPQTLMNDSGRAIHALMSYYKILIQNILVICDDFDLPLGVLRLREKGTSGTHNGLKSVIQAIGMNFTRLRIGIGPLPLHYAITSFVLNNFRDCEQENLAPVLEKTGEIAKRWIKDDPLIEIQQFANTIPKEK